ncbi:MAG: OmpA family protein [Enterobacterales bacterium]|nr:OmpA family protein [Enterobacterales bacterium]
MKKTTLIKILGYSLLFSFSCHASYKTYEAELSESQWIFSGNPLNCQLSHQIPRYGEAIFNRQAGRKQPLQFNLHYKRHPVSQVKIASIESLSPAWFPHRRARPMGQTPIRQGESIFKSSQVESWKLLNELEDGRFPTFRYQAFDSIQDQVAVSLSSVGFNQPFDQFLNCLSSLVPFKLHELQRLTLHFDFDKASIRKNYLNQLKALAAYVRYDPSIEVVFISGYTDSKGPRGYNHKLSKKRIAAVQEILSLDGVSTARFKTLPFGEKNPVASNRKAAGRAKNRRVYIRVSQK